MLRAVLQRAALAAALLWSAALLLYIGSGRWSAVLLAAPVVFAAGDLLASRRKARLAALVDATLLQLVADDGVSFAQAQVLQRRDRLLGAFPPRLHAERLLRANGRRYRLRATLARAHPDAIDWQVARLPDA